MVSELRYLSSLSGSQEYVQLHINIYIEIDAYQYHRVKDVTSFDVVIRCFMSLDFRLFDQFRYTVIKYYTIILNTHLLKNQLTQIFKNI